MKGKVFLVCVMKTYRGISCTVPLLTLATGRCGWLDSRPSPFTPRAEPQYALNRWLNEPQSQSAHIGIEKSLLPLLGFEHSNIQPTPQSLYYDTPAPNHNDNSRKIIIFQKT